MYPNTESAKENKITLWTNWNLCWGVRSFKTQGTDHRREPECSRFKSIQEPLDYTIDKLTNKNTKIVMKTSCKPQVYYFILLFILTIGYIDKVYKSVSSNRSQHIHLWEMCVCCCLCVWAWQRRGESTAGFLVFTPHHSSQWTPSSQCTVQREDIFLYLPVSAKRSLFCSLVS